MSTGKLGFGLMRLPVINGETDKIDHEQLCRMVDLFLKSGFTYFDTSFVYHNGQSEAAIRKALVERHPRESYTLATKFPAFAVTEKEQVPVIFEQQLETCGVEYFDYYLLHNLNLERYETNVRSCNMFEFVQEKKAEGKIRQLGFSYHDSADVLDRILTEHPEVDFVQIVVNYLDWDSRAIQAKECYEVIRRHGKQVVIMETVKGGALAGIPSDIEQKMKKLQPSLSITSWAVRYAAELDGVIAALSGMSNMEQMEDNVSYMKEFVPLSDAEHALLEDAARAIRLSGPLHCADFGKYEGVAQNGMPVADILDIYNSCMIQPDPGFAAEHNYIQNYQYKAGIPKGQGWQVEKLADKDGNDITAMVKECQSWVLEHSF